MNKEGLPDFLRDAWGALVGLEEAAAALDGESDALRDALTGVGHRLVHAAENAELPRLVELGSSLERFGKSFPPAEDPSFRDAAQLIGETLNVLPMVFDNVATDGTEAIPQLDALQWRYDQELPAAEALMAARAAAAAPGEIDLALEAFRRQDPEALSYFGPEAEEHVKSLRAGLRRLGVASPEAGADAQVLRDMFRHAHTIKGAAYTVGCEPVGRLTHALEDLLAAVRRGARQLGAPEIELSSHAVELVGEMLERLGGKDGPPLQASYEETLRELETSGEKAGDAAEPAPAAAPIDRDTAAEVAPSFQPTLRVELARVDRLLDEAGELVVARRRLERTLSGLGDVRRDVADVRRRLLESDDLSSSAAAPVRHRELAADLDELGLDLKHLAAGVESQLGELSKRTRRLRSDIGRLRRLPAGQLFDRFAPMVAERAEELGKNVRFERVGRGVELDSEVMERLVEPLTHLVQNALHHGLEGEHERLEAGKGRSGTLRVEARSEGRAVRLTVADDGRGIDFGRLRSKAVERGLLAADLELGEHGSAELLFLPGLSTEDEVTTGAGRGVGMDAVRQAVTDVGGRLDVETRTGQGSRFTLEVPTTLMISEALVVRIGGRRFALPLPAVDRLLHVDDTLLVEQEGARFIDDAGEKIELLSAADRLRLRPGPPPAMPGASGVAVRLSGPHRGTALEVEEVFGASEVVIKSLGPFLFASTLTSGAFVDGDGEVVLLLDPQAMIEATAAGEKGTERAGAKARPDPSDEKGPLLLLADDSLSVRRVLSRRLRRAGYRVLTARDGAEALDLLLERTARGDDEVHGLVTDLEMPHLAGDVLIRRLRRHPRWRRLPVVVVTGRPEQLLRLGADEILRKPVPEGALEGVLARFFVASRASAGVGS